MIKKIPFIQILTAMYILSIAVYMIYNDSSTQELADYWKNYYWIVNKSAMLMALLFNYKINKTKAEWLTINFLTLQTSVIILYFSIGLPNYLEWMRMNDAIIYSFFIGSFLAVIIQWVIALWRAKE